MEDEYMTAGEAARALGVNPRTISRLIKRKELPAITTPMNRRLRLVRRADVEALAKLQYRRKR